MCKSNIHNCFRCGNEVKRNLSRKRDGQLADRIFCSRICYDEQRVDDRKSKAKSCKNCGKALDAPSISNSRKYCSMECRSLLAAKNAVTTCVVCGAYFTAIKWNKRKFGFGLSRDKTRKVCSPECHHMFYRIDEERKRKISESERGEKHHNWRGGTHRMGGRGAGWTVIAEKVRKRAGYKCEHCGKAQDECGRKLDVNHIEPFHQSRNKTHANRLSNLEALCKSCHMKTEWKWRKENPVQSVLNLFEGY